MQILVPVATLDPGEWSVNGAPTTHEAIDEGTDTPDDAGSYLQAFGGFAAGTVRLATGETPSSTSGWQLKVRCTIFVGTPQNMRVRLFEGATELLTWNPNCAVGTWNTRVLDIDPADVAGVSDFADLRVELFTSDLPLFDFFRVSTVDLHLPDAPVGPDNPLVANRLEARLGDRAATQRAAQQSAQLLDVPASAGQSETAALEAELQAARSAAVHMRASGQVAVPVIAPASAVELVAGPDEVLLI